MVMQFIDGSDLHTILSSYRADGEFIETTEALQITRDVCLALDYVHRKGVIHRDIKPSNILLDKEGHAFLSDFGLALLTRFGTLGQVFGSPQYIAPEQAISSARAEPRSDLYSVGIILYEMFTGQLPFLSQDSVEQAMQHIQAPAPHPQSVRPEIPVGIAEVILKALEKDPEKRYPSGAALVKALEQAIRASQSNRATPPPTVSSLTIPERVQLYRKVNTLAPLPVEKIRPEISRRSLEPSVVVKSPLFLGVGAIILFLLCLCGIFAGAFAGVFRLRSALLSSTPTATALPSARLSPSLTATALVSASLLPTPASTAAIASPIPFEFSLRLIKSKDDSLILLNEGELDFPLAWLQLGNTPSKITGEEWGVELLRPGECVAAWKNPLKNELPKGVDCLVVGTSLERSGKVRFWTDSFNIYYQDEFIGACTENQDECEFKFNRH
jgi:serine/threonine protein kinase